MIDNDNESETKSVDLVQDYSNGAVDAEISQDMLPAPAILPSHLTIMPLQGRPIFPGIMLPVILSGETDLSVIQHTQSNGGFLGLLLTKEPNTETTSFADLHQIGTLAKIYKTVELPDGSLNVFLTTLQRFTISAPISEGRLPLVATIDYPEEILGAEINEIKGMIRSIFSELRNLSEKSPFFTEQMRLEMFNIDQPGKVADIIASILSSDRQTQQEILETLNIHDRLEKVILLIKREQELTRIQNKVSKEINERVEKIQREHFLREELKVIKNELGENIDAKSAEIQKFRRAIDALNLQEDTKEAIEKEFEKFQLLEPSSADYGVSRNYLETIISLPWNQDSKEKINLEKSQKILDEDHYGLQDPKERILEFLAVRKLKKHTSGGIICLVGPPGVGKTSIGQSIARAMGRKFFRFSVGGMRDEAEIKGHRRTYVGAMPGKIIQGLKISKTLNPVFMIDEIDKLANSYHGDPSSALLEVLDPSQNSSFRDNYLDLPFDLSHVFFIATANTLDSIPGPLLDRMEVIRIPGYTAQEKEEIAKKYIIPKSLESHGLCGEKVIYENGTIRAIANGYTREAGMRNFEKMINRIHRKIAKKIALDPTTHVPICIQESALEDYLKKAPFPDDELLKITNPGMSVGLAWTSMGGDTLMIEAVALPSDKGPILQLTGQMGDVMKESAHIAYTCAQQIASQCGASDNFFEKHHIHLHIPAGATPKDGPSAGITMTTALVSLAMGEKFPPGWAMTGELSLTGNVLAIGGLKEKSIAAQRSKITHIIIPKSNERDLPEIGEAITSHITYHPVERIEEVLALLFPKKNC
ncbi:MAG: endopeptidase La [Spirochaetia bacterium]